MFNLSGNNMMNLMMQWNQFKSTFRGDPKQQVQQMLNSGQMSQEQFNKIAQMANQLQGMFK